MSTTYAARGTASRRARWIAGGVAAALAVAGGFAGSVVLERRPGAGADPPGDKVIEAIEEGRPAIAWTPAANQDWRFVDMEHSPFSAQGIVEAFAEADGDRDEQGRMRLCAADGAASGRRALVDYGLLDGGGLDLAPHARRATLEAGLWLTVLALAVAFAGPVGRAATTLSAMLMALQAAVLDLGGLGVIVPPRRHRRRGRAPGAGRALSAGAGRRATRARHGDGVGDEASAGRAAEVADRDPVRRAPDPSGPATRTRSADPGPYSVDTAEYHARADVWPLDPDGELFVVAMVESAEAVANIDAILAAPVERERLRALGVMVVVRG